MTAETQTLISIIRNCENAEEAIKIALEIISTRLNER